MNNFSMLKQDPDVQQKEWGSKKIGSLFGNVQERFKKPKTKQTNQWVEVVDLFETLFDIPKKGAYGYGSWLKRVKTAKMNIHQAKKVVEIMKSDEAYIKKTTGETMHRGKWVFNRFRYEIKDKGVDAYISSRS